MLSALDSLKPIMASIAYLNVLTPLLSEAHNHRLVRRLSRLGIAYESLDFANRDEGDEGREPAAAISANIARAAAAGSAASRMGRPTTR